MGQLDRSAGSQLDRSSKGQLSSLAAGPGQLTTVDKLPKKLTKITF